MSPQDAVELAGVVFGVVAVWLTVRESVWCWPTGLVYVALFVIVFHQARLYGNMGLQVVYGALCLYGWHEWLHGGKGRRALAVSRITRRALVVLLAGGVAASALLAATLGRASDASLPFWDASTTSFSLVAQAMVTKKWIENWIIWIVVDTVYVGMYVHQELYPTAALYTVYLFLAVMGLREWRGSLAAAPA